jgi:N-acetylmuramoyl-L-alanine amidase
MLCSWGVSTTSRAEDAAETTAQANGSREFTWSTREFGGRDYVPLSDISAFYQLTYRGVDESTAFTTVILGRQMELALAAGRRQIRVNGVLHWLSFPVRRSGGELYLTTLDLLKTVEPALRPELVPELRVPRVIVLDPGHGGHDKGAASPFGHESDFALDVALKTRDILRREGKLVLMTREDDTFVPLGERAGFANQWDNAVFISIHFNAANFADEANGFEIFCLTPRGGPSTMDRRWRSYFDKTHPADPWANAGLALATCVYHSVLAHMQRRDRGVKRQRFAVLKLTRHPSALVECGFLNNREESRVAATAKWRQRLAHAIARGVQDYVKMAETRQKPPTLADYQGLSGAVFERRDGQIRLSPNQPRVDVPSRFDHGSPTAR